jgi:hypothetical protein
VTPPQHPQLEQQGQGSAGDLLAPQRLPSYAPSPQQQELAAGSALPSLHPSPQQQADHAAASMAQLTAQLMSDPFIQALNQITPPGLTSPGNAFVSAPSRAPCCAALHPRCR